MSDSHAACAHQRKLPSRINIPRAFHPRSGTLHPVDQTPSTPAPVRCVLWHARGKPPRPELIAALDRPNFEILRCNNPYHALANACRPRDPKESAVVLLVEPDTLDQLPEFLASADLYAHAAAFWAFEGTAEPRLRTASPADLENWRRPRHEDQPAPQITPPRASDPAPHRSTTAPVLKLSGHGTLPPPMPANGTTSSCPSPHPDVKSGSPPPRDSRSREKAQPASPASGDHPSLLTDEELRMLLASPDDP